MTERSARPRSRSDSPEHLQAVASLDRPHCTSLVGFGRMADMGQPAVNLDELSPEEQLELLDRIWDRLSRNPAAVPVTEAQRVELDSRLDDLEKDIRAGRPLGEPWEEVRKRFR